MAEYARRIHQKTVTLDPNQSKTFQLPPMTPGAVVIDTTVAVFNPPPPSAPFPTVAPVPKPARPLSLTQRLPERDLIIKGPIGDPGGGGTIDPHPPEAPRDLKVDLMRGAQVVATSGGHILWTGSTADDSRYLRLTRDGTGTGPRTYVIEANYPSGLPIVERRISPVAFQRAFDANWNQHPYIAVEFSPHYHVYVSFDEQFRLLYGLENLDVDLGVPSWVPNVDRVTTKSIRFTMGHDLIPLPANIVTPYQVPYVLLRVEMHVEGHGDTWFEARFYLASFSERVSYLTRVKSPIIDSAAAFIDGLPGISMTSAELCAKIEAKLDALGAARFGPAFTPWLQGEPNREMYGLSFDTARNEIVVRFIGSPPPPVDPGIVVGDPSAPPPTTPRLFDTPDEVPPPPPPDPGPRIRYTTTPGALANINHIVVVMQENRSFDQILGYLSRDLGRSDVNGLSADPNSTQLNRYDDGHGERIFRPQRATDTKWFGFDIPGPCHEFECVADQMLDNMGHFVSNYAERVHSDWPKLQRIMDYYGADQLPAFAALAREFAICDAWHCSHAGPTWPNRFVTLTGDLNRSWSGGVELNQPDFDHLVPLTSKTLFDHLNDRGVTWRLYEHGYSFLRLYGRYTFDLQNVKSFTDPLAGFAADARAGRLPQVTFIEPDYIDLPSGNDDHPPGDLADGQRFIANIVSALLESPQWDRTMLIITYDEHGGFYDHVFPPQGPPLTGDLRHYGPRVPAFVVSPWVAASGVSHALFDHTTIPTTILRRFCSPNPPRLSPRCDAANDLRDLIQPAARPRAAFNALHDQLLAVANRPAPAPAPPRKLAKWQDADDFHSLLAYVRSFT